MCSLAPRPRPLSLSPNSSIRLTGNPKTITGFVTNNTPVLLGYGERSQLATEEYIPLTPILEGFVLLKKNEEYEKPE